MHIDITLAAACSGEANLPPLFKGLKVASIHSPCLKHHGLGEAPLQPSPSPREVGAYLVHDGRWGWFDAWLLVRQGQLLQQVHVGQGILQRDVSGHGPVCEGAVLKPRERMGFEKSSRPQRLTVKELREKGSTNPKSSVDFHCRQPSHRLSSRGPPHAQVKDHVATGKAHSWTPPANPHCRCAARLGPALVPCRKT